MAVTLGKRKRRADAESGSSARRSRSESDEDDDTARALFQRAFEAKFKPLEKSTRPVSDDEDDEEDGQSGEEDAESDWSGVSDEENAVEVVEHSQPEFNRDDEGNSGKKAFMSSKPPAIDEIFSKATRKPAKEAVSEETGTEATNLKNDLALQRLLKESHLLDPSSFSRTASNPEGKGRLKALDMRLQDLGAKSSALEQEKMPLSHRRGISAKNASREANRRKEAAENGIILEKQKFAANSQKKRDRGIGGPGVGKFKGGTLKLNSRDVRSIEGSSGSGSGRKGRKK